MTPPLTIYQIIDEVLAAPHLHLGSQSLVALQGYLLGYTRAALFEPHLLAPEVPAFSGFNAFVVARLELPLNEDGWCKNIARTCSAVDGEIPLFAELLVEFRRQQPPEQGVMK